MLGYVRLSYTMGNVIWTYADVYLFRLLTEECRGPEGDTDFLTSQATEVRFPGSASYALRIWISIINALSSQYPFDDDCSKSCLLLQYISLILHIPKNWNRGSNNHSSPQKRLYLPIFHERVKIFGMSHSRIVSNTHYHGITFQYSMSEWKSLVCLSRHMMTSLHSLSLSSPWHIS